MILMKISLLALKKIKKKMEMTMRYNKMAGMQSLIRNIILFKRSRAFKKMKMIMRMISMMMINLRKTKNLLLIREHQFHKQKLQKFSPRKNH